MKPADLMQFSAALTGAWELCSKGRSKPSAESLQLAFAALAGYTLVEVRGSICAHIADPSRGQWPPTPADLIFQLQGQASRDGRPEPDEAWSSALLSVDEDATVEWTEETAAAFFKARPVLLAGDKIGARMAFREVYARLVAEARQARRSIRWVYSEGHDAKRREATLLAGAQAGRIGFDAIRPPLLTSGLLELARAPGAPPEVAEALAALRDRLLSKTEGPSRQAIDHERTNFLKAKSASMARAAQA